MCPPGKVNASEVFRELDERGTTRGAHWGAGLPGLGRACRALASKVRREASRWPSFAVDVGGELVIWGMAVVWGPSNGRLKRCGSRDVRKGLASGMGNGALGFDSAAGPQLAASPMTINGAITRRQQASPHWPGAALTLPSALIPTARPPGPWGVAVGTTSHHQLGGQLVSYVTAAPDADYVVVHVDTARSTRAYYGCERCSCLRSSSSAVRFLEAQVLSAPISSPHVLMYNVPSTPISIAPD